MNALFFWEKAGGLTLEHKCNPYGPLLALAMATLDVHLELGDYAFEKAYLEHKRETHDVLHFNWIRHFYLAEDLETAVARLNKFVENVNYAKRLGYRIVWTMHNFYPHERRFPELDHLAQLSMCRLADHVVTHCGYAADLAREYFYRTEDLHVIPHGNYIDAYSNEISRADARKELGIADDAFVYLFTGNVRPYKGIDRLIETFGEVANEKSVLLLMMHTGMFPAYLEEIETEIKGDDRILGFTSSFFDQSEFQVYLNAADVAVLPFVDVLTSGSAILALSFGKPVILPNIGCLPELIDDSMGRLFDPKDENGLQEAMVAIRDQDITVLSAAAYKRAESLHWDGIAEQLSVLYRG
ncbi:MAG: beta-1,4-mannosyltransferase [Candidatus Latescibacterota bacterium]|jgi:beta-1,4-mannosyltransferase